jgi:hypothetical protein
MSDFRSKAREIKAAGEAERGNFEPTGAPLRLYNYWLSETRSDRGRAIRRGDRKENFCHFWRVVAIWAPLMFLRRKAEAFFTSKVGIAITVAVALFALATVVTTVGDWTDFLLGVGGAVAFVAVLMGIIIGVDWLRQKHEKVLIGIIIAGLAVAVLAFFTALVLDFGLVPVLAWTAGIAGGVAALVFILIKVGEWISGLRSIAKAKAKAEHDAAWEAYLNDEGPNPYARPERKPDPAWLVAVFGFFRGIGDFLILLGQIVRVKKWKICPMVEVRTPQQKFDYDSGWETA